MAVLELIHAIFTPGRGFLTISLAIVCILGDFLLTRANITSSNILRAVLDNGTHGLAGLLSWAVVVNPSLLPMGMLVRDPSLWEILLCGILSSLLDLDHFAAAGTLELQGALSLKSRPPCHAATLIPLVSVCLLLITRLLRLQKLHRLPLIFSVAWLSHHIRDATRRGLWLWPWGSTPPLPYWLYISMIVVLPYSTIAVMNVTNYWKRTAPDSGHVLKIGVEHV